MDEDSKVSFLRLSADDYPVLSRTEAQKETSLPTTFVSDYVLRFKKADRCVTQLSSSSGGGVDFVFATNMPF